MRTIYPYGLNEKASQKDTDSTVIHPAIGKLFPPLPRHGNRLSRARENRNDHTSQISCEEFFQQLDHLLHNDIRNSFNEIRKILRPEDFNAVISFEFCKRPKLKIVDIKHEIGIPMLINHCRL